MYKNALNSIYMFAANICRYAYVQDFILSSTECTESPVTAVFVFMCVILGIFESNNY